MIRQNLQSDWLPKGVLILIDYPERARKDNKGNRLKLEIIYFYRIFIIIIIILRGTVTGLKQLDSFDSLRGASYQPIELSELPVKVLKNRWFCLLSYLYFC